MFTKSNSDDNFKAIHFMIDADGCILKKHTQSVVDENQALIQHMVDTINENHDAEIHVGRTGSLRSSVRMDEEMTYLNKTKYTYFEAINQIVEAVRIRTGRTIIIDDYTISHTVNNIPEGTPVDKLNWRQDCFRDKSKVIPLYGTSHRSVCRVDGKVKIHFYDDAADILTGWDDFFNKCKMHDLLPSQVNVSCHNYCNGLFIKRDLYHIKGTGEINRNYHQGIKQLAHLTDTPISRWFSCYTKLHVAANLAKRESKEILATINSKLIPPDLEEQRLIREILDHCIPKTIFADHAKMLRDAIALAKSLQEVEELIYRELSLFVEPIDAEHVLSQKVVPPLSQQDEYYKSIETIIEVIKKRALVKVENVAEIEGVHDEKPITGSSQKEIRLLLAVERSESAVTKSDTSLVHDSENVAKKIKLTAVTSAVLEDQLQAAKSLSGYAKSEQVTEFAMESGTNSLNRLKRKYKH